MLETASIAPPGSAAVAKYNPHLLGANELRAIFVARIPELDQILQALRSASKQASSAPQHLLITGQRGMGKTTLLQRVALAVEEDAGLALTWLALRFPEDQYTLSTPAELWANVTASLADALQRQASSTLEADQQLLLLGTLPVPEREAHALQWLERWCTQHKRRLLLLIDSTDLVLSNIARADSSAAGAPALWRVRKTLSHAPHFFWLGGSYQPLETNGLYSDAFLDFFQLIELRALTVAQMQAAILALARTFGAGRGLQGAAAEAEVKRLLTQRPERLRAMRQLTGGNPRTTIMLYTLFAAGGEDSVRADLDRLLDDATPLYKARFEVLPEQSRKVLAHVMENWAPVSAKNLAGIAALSTSTVSAQLSRLEQEGLIEKVPLEGTKRHGFQVTERFFNIWHLMRNSQRVLRLRLGWLVEFMRMWYSTDERSNMAQRRGREHQGGTLCDAGELEYSRALSMTVSNSDPQRDQLKRYEEAEAGYQTAIQLNPEDPYPKANLARLLVSQKKHAAASALFREVIGSASGRDLDILLQAHCWLGNNDLALQALNALAQTAASGDHAAFYRIEEQCFECHAMEIGSKLADLMERSPYAGFLQAFSVGLRLAGGQKDAGQGVAVEIRAMAQEVFERIRAQAV